MFHRVLHLLLAMTAPPHDWQHAGVSAGCGADMGV
jgi:hypothetical protein